MRRLILAALLAALPAFAARSVVLTPGFTGTTTTPNSTPFSTLSSYRIELRVHNWTPSASYTAIIQSAQLAIRFVGGANTLSFSSWLDNSAAINMDLLGRSDFLVRIQRDTVNSRLLAEIWNADGSGYKLITQAMTPGSGSLAGRLDFGDAHTNCDLAFFRWYAGTVAVGGKPPVVAQGGSLTDWELENNGNDSSGHNIGISWAGGASYVDTPIYPPAVVFGVPSSVRAGAPVVLDGSNSYSLIEDPSLTYVWQQISFPSTLVWSSRGSPTPTVAGVVSGTYWIQLTVTDANGQSSTQYMKFGAAASESKGIVILADPDMDFLMGPLTKWGTSPWPWFDQVEKADADALFGPGGVPSTPPFGPTPSGNAGRITVTNGSRNVVGAGTQFMTDFACNGTDSIVVYYPLQNGNTGARPYKVVSCADNTHMVVNQWNTNSTLGYDAGGTASGVAYAKVIQSQLGGWIASSTNWNYYDVVLALYKLYYRTGLDTYLIYARQLADNWYVFPLDGGRAYNNGSYPPPGARSASVLGMMARALDGHSERWEDSPAVGCTNCVAGIKGMVDTLHQSFITAFFSLPYDQLDFVDPRETGYASMFEIAYARLHDPSYYAQARSTILGANSFQSRFHAGYGFTTNADPFSASGGYTAFGYSGPNYRGSFWLSAFLLKAAIKFYEIAQTDADKQATLTLIQDSADQYYASHFLGGSCRVIAYAANYVSCDSGSMPSNPVAGLPPGTVSATSGSTAVTGTGTAFTSAPFTNDGRDYIGINVGTGFVLTNIASGGVMDSTHLSLAAPYAGTTGSALQFGRALECPNGTGHPNVPQNTYFNLNSQNAAAIDTCESPPHYGMGGRAVSELFHQVNGFLYFTTGLSKYKTQGDDLFAAAYGCGSSTQGCVSGGSGLANNITGGGPGADGGAGNFADVLLFPIDSSLGRGKEFGSNAGAGYADSYLAYRLGGQDTLNLRAVDVNFDLSSIPGATQIRVIVTQPSGQVSVTFCSTSPCSAMVDPRQGDHLMELDYLSMDGQVLAAGEQQILGATP